MKSVCSLFFVLFTCLVASATEPTTASDSNTKSHKPFPGLKTPDDMAEWQVLKKEFYDLEPFNVTATSFTMMKISSGTVIVGCRDVGLRIERFLCAEPETELDFVRIPFETNGVTRCKIRVKRVRDDATVEKGRARNRVARRIFAEFLSEPHREVSAEIQEFWLLAAMSVWIDGVNGLFREAEATARRREEDGIPSAEALLEWFAENESFCESVRADAKARLESLEKNPAPKPDAQPVATIAAEGQEQDVATGEEAE